MRRSKYIEDVLYTISGGLIKMKLLLDLIEMGQVAL